MNRCPTCNGVIDEGGLDICPYGGGPHPEPLDLRHLAEIEGDATVGAGASESAASPKPLVISYDQHYDASYWLSAKKYHTPDGAEHTYTGPAIEWFGFKYVAEALAAIIPPREGQRRKTLLDIGCSGGDLAGRLLDLGYSSYGVDISEFALERTVMPMRGRTAYADITECPKRLMPYMGTLGEWPDRAEEFPDKFDVVIATDVMEHLYITDLENTLEWMIDRAKKWMFFLIAVTTGEVHKREFIHKRGEPVPIEWEATAISGHVHVRHWKYWVSLFERTGLRVRWDLGYKFQMQREDVPEWRNTAGWGMPSTWFLEKP